MEKEIKLGVYKILRKLGVDRDEIYPEAQFKNDLFFDDLDMTCFLFFIESKFNIDISDEETISLKTIDNSIAVVDRHLQEVIAC